MTATAKPTLADEAKGNFTTLLYEGDVYTLPPSSDDVDLGFLEAYEANRLIAAVEILVGVDQWKKFRAKHKTVGEFKAFLNAATEAMGGNF